VTPFRVRKVKHLPGEDNFGVAQPVFFTGTSMSNRQLAYNRDVNVQIVY